ncbi:hypothetical protein HYDPIDRAFT_34210 [Hydnomerulius pinastri MD-312]|uniref:Uncharacterized protein n=1 Tax=Hydnomerulius pinastri MD-312 TaxID=994086 RepID=A0A0C9VLC7_9AGAM|nr:hypothetical protein HYDPIDRAFT_34210 [Hydnomerulius pinastri MD-312]
MKSGKPIAKFIDARPEDLPFTSGEGPSRRRQKRNYLKVDDQSDDDKHNGMPVVDSAWAGKAKAASSHHEERPRRAKSPTPATIDSDSPATHKSANRMLYLQLLSIDSRYQKLLELLFRLPKTGSSSPQRSALPKWASWTWDRKFLPRDLHTSGDSFRTALATLKNFRWSTAGGGTLIVLGFGLLMRECARAQEAKDDDTSSPSFLLSSRLGVQRLDDVVDAVVEVTSRVKAELEGSSDEEERRQEEEERKREEEERKQEEEERKQEEKKKKREQRERERREEEEEKKREREKKQEEEAKERERKKREAGEERKRERGRREEEKERERKRKEEEEGEKKDREKKRRQVSSDEGDEYKENAEWDNEDDVDESQGEKESKKPKGGKKGKGKKVVVSLTSPKRKRESTLTEPPETWSTS